MGSAVKLSFAVEAKKAVWKLDDDDDEVINDDDLLDEEDLKKPDPSSLRGKFNWKIMCLSYSKAFSIGHLYPIFFILTYNNILTHVIALTYKAVFWPEYLRVFKSVNI